MQKTKDRKVIQWILDSSSSFNLSHMMETGINKKAEGMTGLRSSGSSASDPAVVVNHLPGGLEDLHLDMVRPF